jgi:hypothetical protein
MIHYHLCIVEGLYSMDHLTLNINKSALVVPYNSSENNLGPAPNVRHVLSGLLDVLLKIQRLNRRDLQTMSPAPWSLKSEFCEIKRELDQWQLRNPEEITFSKATFQHFLRIKSGVGEYVMCCLLYYFCLGRLNRVFLSIPTQARKNTSNGKNPTVLPDIIHYPLAPRVFLLERLHSAMSSSRAVARICRQVLGNATFIFVSRDTVY